jgi:hypothetical protein
MSGTLLVALSALLAAIAGAALIAPGTDDAWSEWPDAHARERARSPAGDSDPELN